MLRERCYCEVPSINAGYALSEAISQGKDCFAPLAMTMVTFTIKRAHDFMEIRCLV